MISLKSFIILLVAVVFLVVIVVVSKELGRPNFTVS